ncbi:UNVERIFIED_CONTAM: hypothetical protein FKN15_058586 [Acipenser sinensis]
MCSVPWTSPVRVQAIPQLTVDGKLPGGGAQLAERRRGGRVSSAHRAPATPVVWPGTCGLACKLPRAALSSDAVALRRLHSESAECKEAGGSEDSVCSSSHLPSQRGSVRQEADPCKIAAPEVEPASGGILISVMLGQRVWLLGEVALEGDGTENK